jgi:hypothetical protein
MNIRQLQFRHGFFPFRRSVSAAGFLLLLLIAVECPARAYTDPGTGTMMYQILGAAFLGVGFYTRKVIRWFRMRRKG